jgi:uncharacterized protein YkwD
MRRALAIFALAAALIAASGCPAAVGAAPFDRLLAPARSCAGAARLHAPIRVQEQAMRCLTDFARVHAGLAPLADYPALNRSAALKSRDILRCDQFDHQACGRPFFYWMKRDGYLDSGCWRVGENIAFGTGERGTPRSIFEAWLGSADHRHNILGPYRDLGIGLRVGTLGNVRHAHVWTQHFGKLC